VDDAIKTAPAAYAAAGGMQTDAGGNNYKAAAWVSAGQDSMALAICVKPASSKTPV
jgi:hypothetical protein